MDEEYKRLIKQDRKLEREQPLLAHFLNGVDRLCCLIPLTIWSAHRRLHKNGD